MVIPSHPDSDSDTVCVCVCSGAVLLDLKQNTMPDITQQVVKEMMVSEQLKAEDQARVF